MKAEVVVVYQSVDALHQCLATAKPPDHLTTQQKFGDWYFTGDYPTPGGYKVLHKALLNYLDRRQERSY